MPIDPRIPQCQHVKISGVRCGSPALRDYRFCYYHYEVRRPRLSYGIPPLEDANSVQFALMELARAILNDSIDPKRAALLAYVLQTASANLKRVRPEPYWEDVVREHPAERHPRFADPDTGIIPPPLAFASDLTPDLESGGASNADFVPPPAVPKPPQPAATVQNDSATEPGSQRSGQTFNIKAVARERKRGRGRPRPHNSSRRPWPRSVRAAS